MAFMTYETFNVLNSFKIILYKSFKVIQCYYTKKGANSTRQKLKGFPKKTGI